MSADPKLKARLGIALIGVLMFKPSGLFGEKTGERS